MELFRATCTAQLLRPVASAPSGKPQGVTPRGHRLVKIDAPVANIGRDPDRVRQRLFREVFIAIRADAQQEGGGAGDPHGLAHPCLSGNSPGPRQIRECH